MMDEEAFRRIASKIRNYTDFIYLHIMGEPLLHPELQSFLSIADACDLKVIITTNGTLLSKCGEILLTSPAVHKVNISLHSLEANEAPISFLDYMDHCIQFARESDGNKLVVFRLWNQGGLDQKNTQILNLIEETFPKPWRETTKGIGIGKRTFIEYGEKFDWPDLNAPDRSGRFFCYGLRDQFGILWDGTVVPCCLDHEGDIALGNIHSESLESILESQRAQAIYDGFRQGKAAEELCRRCGFASRFTG